MADRALRGHLDEIEGHWRRVVVGRFRCGCENHWDPDTRIYVRRDYCAQHQPSRIVRLFRWITRQGPAPAGGPR